MFLIHFVDGNLCLPNMLASIFYFLTIYEDIHVSVILIKLCQFQANLPVTHHRSTSNVIENHFKWQCHHFPN